MLIMNSKKILTISIAAFNVEPFIRQTLNSLVVRDILDEVEVLINDDGGSDSSLDIAKEYQEKYPDTFKAIHKENGGYGSVFNYNIKIAKGKYFKLLDGDDWFNSDGLLKLVVLLKNNDADVIFTQYNYATNNEMKLAIKYDDDIVDKVLSVEDFKFNAGTPMHALTYKTDVLRESGMSLKEHILYTDNTYAAKPFLRVNTILFSNTLVYNYRLGLTTQSVGRQSIVKHIEESKEVSLDLVEFYCNYVNDSVKSKNCIRVNIASTCVNYVVGILKMPMCVDSLNRLIRFDKEVRELSLDLFDKMGKLDRKASKSLYLIRQSNYLLYWLFAFIYRFID